MTRHKFFKRLLPIILSAMLLFSALPVSASANDESTDEVASKIVREVVELREKSVKHFLCEDGSYIAVSYAEPVHYEKNGEWLEIDNTLVLSNKNTYVPKSNDLAVSIPQSFSGGEQITATNKGHTISFGVASSNENVALSKTAAVKAVEALPSSIAADVSVETLANAELSSTATVGKVDTAAQIEAHNSEKTTVDNQAGALVYDKLFPNADLEYIVTGNSIKENVVVYQPQNEYVYTFDMDFGGLTPVAQEDGSYKLVDSAKPEETVFVLAAPYMYDANGEESYEVEMSLTENGDNYLLTLTADEEWINSSERAFPVVIDPTITLPNDEVDYNFNDVFVIDGILDDSTKDGIELRAGRNLANLTRTYLKPDIPSLPTGAVLDNAQLILQKKTFFNVTSADSMEIYIFDCYGMPSWSPETITWNNQPYSQNNNGYSADEKLSSCIVDSGTQACSFDITSAVERWLSTGTNSGLMLASATESQKMQVDFFSSRAWLFQGKRPQMTFTYSLPGIDTNLLTFDSSSATSSEIEITTSAAWTVTVDQPWISVSQTSGTGITKFTVSVTENTSTEQREGTVTVWMGSVIIGEITVRQSGSGAYLFLDETPIFIDYKTCSKTVMVDTNDSLWGIVLELWNNANNTFESVIIDGNNNENAWLEVKKGTDKIDLTVRNENTEAFTRKARITVTAQSDTNTVTKTIQITQYDKVTCLFNTINEDGTLSAISSIEYNHALATWAMELSYAAYNYPDGTELDFIPGAFMGDVVDTAADVLINHGFGNIIEPNYTSADCGAHTIAYRDIEFPVAENATNNEGEEDYDSNMGSYQSNISGAKYDSIYTDSSDTGSNRSTVLLSETDTANNTRRIVVVAVRGSVTDSDWDNNMITQFVPCDNKFAEMKNTVVDNLENHISGLSNSIILITGHSLGAAIANLLAAELSSTLGVENVYAYTFATPQVVTESLGQEAIPYGNIFNILNSNDVVTYMPTTLIVPFANFWSRHGVDISIDMPFNEYLPEDPLGIFCHSMAVYMAWMNNNPDMTYESIMEESAQSHIRGVLPVLARIKCPVGVTIKNSENKIIAYETLQEGIDKPGITETGIVSWSDAVSGEKVFFIPHYADAAKIEIDAYDYGSMTMTMSLLGVEEADETDESDATDETTEVLNSITYNNVNLFPGRAFDVDLTEITEEVSMDDISLMEVEVNENGEREEIGEITNLNPYLISASVDVDEVVHGQPCTMTFVTHKDAVKTQIQYNGTVATVTFSRDHPWIVSLVEDGDTLIWTIQPVLNRIGEHVFDVNVKMGSTWYPTEKVFALTIT